jgi:hypothetical protein
MEDLQLLIWNCYSLEDFSHILILPVWISVHELEIPCRISFLLRISCLSWLFQAESHSSSGFLVTEMVKPWQNNYSSGGFLVNDLVITNRIPMVGFLFMRWQFSESPSILFLLRTATVAVIGRVESEWWQNLFYYWAKPCYPFFGLTMNDFNP